MPKQKRGADIRVAAYGLLALAVALFVSSAFFLSSFAATFGIALLVWSLMLLHIISKKQIEANELSGRIERQEQNEQSAQQQAAKTFFTETQIPKRETFPVGTGYSMEIYRENRYLLALPNMPVTSAIVRYNAERPLQSLEPMAPYTPLTNDQTSQDKVQLQTWAELRNYPATFDQNYLEDSKKKFALILKEIDESFDFYKDSEVTVTVEGICGDAFIVKQKEKKATP